MNQIKNFTVKKWYQTISNGQRMFKGWTVIDEKGEPSKNALGHYEFFKSKNAAVKQAEWMTRK